MHFRAEGRTAAGGGRCRDALVALALLALLAGLAGCGPRYRRVVVQDQGGIEVTLRGRVKGGKLVPRGFAHPAIISGIRLSHILARIDIRMSSGAENEAGNRRPAVPTELIYPMGDALSAGLARADENQEVVVEALRKQRRLGIFTDERMTSLVAWVEGETLVIHVGRSDDLIPKGELDDVKEPIPGRAVQQFNVVATEGLVPVAEQAISAHWRDPIFREARNIRVGPTGKVMRRTILMEEAPETPADDLPPARLPSDPQALRELADLEELRRAGEISEAEYHRRRSELLRGGSLAPEPTDRQAPEGP
jgi:hypothetical protein